jgi:hypothetical protein
MPVSPVCLRKIYAQQSKSFAYAPTFFAASNAVLAGASEFFEGFVASSKFVAFKREVNSSMNLWARLHSGMF